MIRKVSFTLGDNAGKLLIDIAREHLIYNYNPDKALKTIQSSLNCSKEIALDIIIGKMILLTNEDRVSFNGIMYDPAIHKEIFPPLDIEGWAERKLLNMKRIAAEWYSAITELRAVIIKNRGEFDFSVRYEDLIKFFYDGDSENLIDIDNDTTANIKCCVTGIRNFIEECMKVLFTIEWLSKAYPGQIPEGFNILPPEVRGVSIMLFELMNGDSEVEQYIRRDTINMMMVDNYIKKQVEIDRIISNGIQPVDITDGYNAGWLAPDGTYYGLNGEISNMLHNQIADALVAAEIIPIGSTKNGIDNRKNPDEWLERNGWVKIHGNWILFDGWNQHLLHKDNIALTKEQKDAIYRYGQACCDGILQLGYSKESISAARFNMTDLLMLKKYFEL